MNGWMVPFDSDLLLTIGWGVLMTAALGIIAAVIVWISQLVLPPMPADRRAWLVLAAFAGSLALAWAGPAAELLPNERPAVSVSRPSAAGIPATPLPITSYLPSSLQADAATSAFVGTSVRVVAVAWMLFAAALLVRLAGGLWISGRIRRQCRPAPSGDLIEAADRLRARLGIRRRVEILQVADAGAPFSIGWRVPAVVIPCRTTAVLSRTEVESLLAHELAHVRRADYAIGIIQAALDAFCWLSPGHHRLSDEVRTLREQACDDIAVSLSGDVRTYANALKGVAHLGAAAPLAPLLHVANRHVAARIRRLLGDDAPPPAGWYGWTMAAALLAFGVGGAVTVQAAASMPPEAWSARDAAGSGDAWRAHLERTGIPLGFAPRQSGSPVVLSEVAPSESYVFDSVLVRNASPSRLTSVTFAALVEWRSTPSTPGLPVLVVETKPLSVTLAPGSSVTVPLNLLPVRQALALKAKSDGLMQVFLTAVATVTEAAAWSMPLQDAAVTHREAMGLPVPTVPRSMVSVDPPAGPAATLCRTDEPDSETSPGGIYGIRGEQGRWAKCVNGGWIEVFPDEAASDVVRLQFELRQDRLLRASPVVKVQNHRTGALSFEDGATRVAFTPSRVGESVEIDFVIITAERTITPRLVVDVGTSGSISWKSSAGSWFELLVTPLA